MMRRLGWAVGLALATLLVFTIAALLDERQRASKLELDLTRICQNQRIAAEALVTYPFRRPPGQLMTSVRLRASDHAILTYCLGTELPVDTSQAEGCWVLTGDDDCFLDPAKELAEQYRRRWPD